MNTATAAASLTLTDAEIAHFHARGWVVRRQLCNAHEVARIAAEIDGLHERMAKATKLGGWEVSPEGAAVSWEENLPADHVPRIRQLMHSERVSPLLDTVSKSEALLAIMRQLIGPDLMLFHSKLMMKAAHDGSFTPWHQDFQYWQYESKLPTQVNCMLHVDEADLENGCLRMVDGSQKQGLLPIKHLASSSFSLGLEGDLDTYPDASRIAMQPGDAIFFGALVIHGSGPNTSHRHRRANTFAFDQPGNRLKDELPAENWRCGRRG